jgi:hypothetical protein
MRSHVSAMCIGPGRQYEDKRALGRVLPFPLSMGTIMMEKWLVCSCTPEALLRIPHVNNFPTVLMPPNL